MAQPKPVFSHRLGMNYAPHHRYPRWWVATCDKCGKSWAVHDKDIAEHWKPSRADCPVSDAEYNRDHAADTEPTTGSTE